jgi:EmrB/QacA subfamily drug resistance transporter
VSAFPLAADRVTTAPDPRRWKALALLCAAIFMTVVDVSIVTVAIPTIGIKLHFSSDALQWVLTAYALTFGGFLLLGGRAADLLGRRRVFMVGLALFTLASLWCGLSNSEGMLIAARAVQGLGAAIISPAALSIVSTTFQEGAERNKALGIWGAVGGSGAAVGVVLGGVLTKYLGWEWIFFVNVPVGAAALLLTPRFVGESRIVTTERSYDPLGAVSVTLGLVALVYAISKAPFDGWGSAKTIVGLVVAAVLLVGFVIIERTVRDPVMPLRIFRVRTVAGANVAGALLGAVIFANFFVLTQYVQTVLHYSALKAGVTFVATAGTAVLAAGLAQALATRFGVKPVMAIGFALMAAGMVWYTQLPVHGSFAPDLLPGYLMVGVGLPFGFVPVTIAALAGIEPGEAGLASGMINTSQQIGGAIGVAITATVYLTHFKNAVRTDGVAVALTDGYQLAFWVCAGFAVAGLVATLTLIRREELAAAPEVAPTAG